MYSTGIVRRVDKLGRIALPMELRRELGLKGGELLSILVDGDRIDQC